MFKAFLKLCLDGLVYYKLVVLELTLLIFLSWAGAVMTASEGMTEAQWLADDSFAHKRYYIGILIVVATAIKGFFSTAVKDAKQNQAEGNANDVVKKEIETKKNDGNFPTP